MQTDLRHWLNVVTTLSIRLDEAVDNVEYTLYKRGEADGLTGPPDAEIFALPRAQEDAYFRGYRYGKEQRELIKARSAKVRLPTLPVNLKGIKRSDLKAAYETLIMGHSTDEVRETAAREPAEAIKAMTDALANLSAQFSDGTITLYRTIQMNNPKAWVLSRMTMTQRLGRYWSFNENYVIAHAESERVLFCVNAPVMAVDWPETIVLTVDGLEDEVRLREGAAVTLQYVEPAPYNFRPKLEQMV